MRFRRSHRDHSRAADEDLIERIRNGDHGAFEVLFDRHERVVWSLALRLLGDRANAEDLAQEVFLAVWRGSGRYRPSHGSVRTWLLSIVHHRAVDRLRTLSAGERRNDALKNEAALMAAVPDTAETVSDSIDAHNVRSALAELPQDQREVVRLAYFGGYSQTEIATLMSLPLGTVKSRMRLGLTKIRTTLDAEGLRP